MSEKNIQSAVMMAASEAGARVFRNNVGVAIAVTPPQGKSWTTLMNKVLSFVKNLGGFAAPIKYGLCEGSSDLIGYKSIVITDKMCGTKIAQFVALEIKTPTGSIRPEQAQFIVAARSAGALAGIVRSPDEAIAVLNPLEGI